LVEAQQISSVRKPDLLAEQLVLEGSSNFRFAGRRVVEADLAEIVAGLVVDCGDLLSVRRPSRRSRKRGAGPDRETFFARAVGAGGEQLIFADLRTIGAEIHDARSIG
jgi:hypothetical protein